MTQNTSRLAMIVAAERIIAERGMPALTLKDVQIEANQSNKSAAKYHFGSREGLIEALVEVRMSPVDARRQELLDEMEQLGAPATARQAVEALVRPLASETLDRPGSRYARFLIQALFDPALAHLIQRHLRAESYRRVHRLLIELCPAPGELAQWRADNIVTLTMTALAAREGTQRTPAQTAAIVSDLVDTCVAVLDAPTSAQFRSTSDPTKQTYTQGVSQ
ncbi:AcrR family transcriptional regulator [Prescottella agglutinans]|uniref:AcrR family transcriptional regulator n=2 Tax=Prescottella agglutinans TaxID=1644129 RepID=A0ABT6MGL9_9NOCA|nr:AcrR family transcriptional regulator [Prescottella agglutinans]